MPNTNRPSAPEITPHLNSIIPPAAMPNGEVELRGSGLGPANYQRPEAVIGDVAAPVIFSQQPRAILRVPDGAISGPVLLTHAGRTSNPLDLRVAVPIAESLHPVSNPATDAEGNIYATFSGARGQEVPVSVFHIGVDFQIRPFVSGILNATGLALDPHGYLYASSRQEGTVYRISPDGAKSVYAEGMGVATGMAFDREGNLYVGDRSGTIFKIAQDRQIFVFATLEPSIAAYHLAFNDEGTLFVCGPTTSSYDSIHAVARNGDISTFYRGLGRPQGMAFDREGNLYVAASLHGRRGIIRIPPSGEAALAVAGSGLVGLAFLPEGDAVLATASAVYHLAMGVPGRSLI